MRGQAGEGTGQAQNGTGVQPVTDPVNCTTPLDSPISPATQAGQEYVTPITDGETKAEAGTRLDLEGCSIPGEGHTSGLGMAWELAAHREAGIFAAGMLRSVGLTGKPSGPGASQAAGSLPRTEATDRPVWRPGGLGSLFTGL